jgi:hypothetical protein
MSRFIISAHRAGFVAFCFAVVVATAAVFPPVPADTPPPAPEMGPSPEASAMTNMLIRPLGSGVFEVGRVRLSKRDRTVSFPAVVNLRQGLVEYFIVTQYGRTHESVLRTLAEPYHLHIAMLLLDAIGDTNAPGSARANGDPAAPREVPGGPTIHPWLKPIEGDEVTLEVSWSDEGKAVRRRAEELVLNQSDERMMTPGAWIYNGSFVHQGSFRAQMDGSVASVIADPAALINNPRPGRENDEIWLANSNNLPPVNTPVEVTIRLN